MSDVLTVTDGTSTGFVITEIDYDSYSSMLTLTWTSKPGDTYAVKFSEDMTDWEGGFKQERLQAGPPPAEMVNALVDDLFIKIIERSPTTREAEKYALLTESYLGSLGNLAGIKKLIQTLMLRSDFVYRSEFGQAGAIGRLLG